MKQRRTGKKPIHRSKNTKSDITQRLDSCYERTRYKKTYEKMKQGNQDTIERQAIQKEIMRLRDYGFPQEEAIRNLKNQFSDSKYQEYFINWVKDQYAKIKPRSSSREDDLSL